MNKLYDQITLEELIELAKGETQTGDKGLSHAEEFILALNIHEGPDKVLSTEIWFRYKQWCEETNKRRGKRQQFFKDFNSIFRRRKNSENRFYRVNAEPFVLNPRYQRKLQRWREVNREVSKKYKARLKEERRQKRLAKKEKSITETNSPIPDSSNQ